jgi:hypothetical protein
MKVNPFELFTGLIQPNHLGHWPGPVTKLATVGKHA